VRDVHGAYFEFHVKQTPRSEMFRQIEQQSESWGVSLDEGQIGALLDYAEVMSAYELANVVGTRDVGALVRDHILDSLSCRLFASVRDAGRIVDVGAGAGLPGIPLAITASASSVVLLEATGKKARFLEHAVSRLGIENVRVANGRVEEYAHQSGYRESFDLATARALAALPVVVEYLAPLLRIGGYGIAMKAGLPEDEVGAGKVAARAVGARISNVLEVPFQVEEKERRLVIVEKMRHTPASFPRAVGLPKKKPLGTDV
jgi:16S rRNA (guanine527-N7)-methyltransferase